MQDSCLSDIGRSGEHLEEDLHIQDPRSNGLAETKGEEDTKEEASVQQRLPSMLFYGVRGQQVPIFLPVIVCGEPL